VAECAVFGIPDPKWGEVPAAFIRLATGATASVAEIEQFCREQASAFKRPKLIEFVAEFPRTPVGKIQKNVLRQRFR
jgi:fatty-acyl-CoA synthase